MAGKEPRQWGPGSSAQRSPDSRSQQFTLVHPKKGRSQDRDSKEEPENLDSRMEAAETEDVNKIKDILDDILDLKDQMKPQQGQLAYLLYHEADRQRADSGKENGQELVARCRCHREKPLWLKELFRSVSAVAVPWL